MVHSKEGGRAFKGRQRHKYRQDGTSVNWRQQIPFTFSQHDTRLGPPTRIMVRPRAWGVAGARSAEVTACVRVCVCVWPAARARVSRSALPIKPRTFCLLIWPYAAPQHQG